MTREATNGNRDDRVPVVRGAGAADLISAIVIAALIALSLFLLFDDDLYPASRQSAGSDAGALTIDSPAKP